ncbi:MAG: hypothetical protein JWN86_2456 [Planctomycetota bacterium]|nr:hypothetical protein [Planctomycetota bacterium]
MSDQSSASPHRFDPRSPADLLDETRNHPEWDEAKLAEQLDRLIGGFSQETLISAVRPRLRDLREGDGEILLQLVEALASPDLLDELAAALLDQMDLPTERLWMALGVLDGSGRVEASPILVELRDELDDLIGGDDSLIELAAQIEGDPDSIAVAIEGLSRIEPEVRAEIIAGLARESPGPGVRALLELLTESDDPRTREAAGKAIKESPGNPHVPEPAEARGLATTISRPRIVRSAVGSMTAEGRGPIALLVEESDGWAVAMFDCDVMSGIGQVSGTVFPDRDRAERHYAELVTAHGIGTVHDRHELAIALLSGASWLSGESMTAEARAWISRSAGTDFQTAPIFTGTPPEYARPTTHTAPRGDAKMVLDARPSWRDDSELACRLAIEIALREGDVPPDPLRDPGPFRVLFEGRISGQIELYRRMLLWTALAWMAEGREDLAGAGMRIAAELGDPQHAVPGHPFLSMLMSRSLAHVQTTI